MSLATGEMTLMVLTWSMPVYSLSFLLRGMILALKR
jgi:hypothetical protein